MRESPEDKDMLDYTAQEGFSACEEVQTVNE
jgi:hypothetical protein